MSETPGESSILLWALGALILFMAAHVLLGWVRNARDQLGWRRWAHGVLAALVLASAQVIAVPLFVAGEALSYSVGYRPVVVLVLWLGAVAILTLVTHLLVWRPSKASATAAGTLLALVAAAMQVGMILAIGSRPGISWQYTSLVLACMVMALGFGAALILAYPDAANLKRFRYSWRVGAAGLMAVSFLAGFSFVLVGAGLQTQLGSVYRHALPGNMLALFGGGLLPLLLGVLIVDLEYRRRQRRRRARHRPHFGSSQAPGNYASEDDEDLGEHFALPGEKTAPAAPARAATDRVLAAASAPGAAPAPPAPVRAAVPEAAPVRVAEQVLHGEPDSGAGDSDAEPAREVPPTEPAAVGDASAKAEANPALHERDPRGDTPPER